MTEETTELARQIKMRLRIHLQLMNKAGNNTHDAAYQAGAAEALEQLAISLATDMDTLLGDEFLKACGLETENDQG